MTTATKESTMVEPMLGEFREEAARDQADSGKSSQLTS